MLIGEAYGGLRESEGEGSGDAVWDFQSRNGLEQSSRHRNTMLSTWPTGSCQGASGNLMCLDPQSKGVAEVSRGRLGASPDIYWKALGDRKGGIACVRPGAR